jgi:hypothetical protein
MVKKFSKISFGHSSSGVRDCVFGQVVLSVSKECGALIFMDRAFREERLCAILMDAQPSKMKAPLIFLELLHVDTQRMML